MEGYGPPRFAIGDQWEMYQERLEQYFVAVDLEEEQVYQTVKNICHPAKPNEKSYVELCALLKGRFCPTMVTYRERAVFYRARQESGETVQEWYVRLKKLSLNCEFGEHLDHALKDIFVTGLQPGPIFERLCEEEDFVPLENLLRVAAKKEATLKNRGVLEVNKISEKKANYGSKPSKKPSSASCFACGKNNHDFRSCQYRSYVCKICKEKGHIAVVCPKKQKGISGRKDSNVNHLEVNNIGCCDPYFVNVAVNGRITKFEMDTGSPITIISETFYRNHFEEFPLHPFRGKLVFYTGGEASPKGAFDAVLVYQGRQAVGQVVVIEGGRNPLIGRDFIGKLLKFQINKLDTESPEKHEEQLNAILNRYGELFDGSLGCYKYAKVNLQLKPDVEPKFFKPRKIPVSFQSKVEKELENLEKTGIITKAETAEWGTPLVPVLKKDKSIRLCADYRVTVNPHLEDKRYPMPVVEDLFDALQGDLPAVLITDASGKGIGAVLLQVFPDGSQRPVTFISRVLKSHEQEYSPLDMEALAVYYAVRRLSGYLLGRSFTILTDHQPLVSLFGRKGIPDMVFGKLQRWAVFLANYEYEIKYIKGVNNKVADFLSRSPVQCNHEDVGDDEEVLFLQYIESETRSLVERKQLIVESRRDPVISRIVNFVKTGWPNNVEDPDLKKFSVRKDELVVEEGVLMWGYRIVAPTKLRPFLLQELHSTHLGIVKMKSLARNYFWWPNIDKDIEDMEEPGARGGDIQAIEHIPDDEYLSAEDDDIPEPMMNQQSGHYREDGVYVTRSNRMVRAPDRY
ncbi:uncharacterized protein LOC134290338 [Aedes albopictus]|uniref:RNA-directed DNA polymerase n=1 Tax=Aedes albopictus TaxID=7160 RepID=A0ABM1Z989_AEDAL